MIIIYTFQYLARSSSLDFLHFEGDHTFLARARQVFFTPEKCSLSLSIQTTYQDMNALTKFRLVITVYRPPR